MQNQGIANAKLILLNAERRKVGKELREKWQTVSTIVVKPRHIQSHKVLWMSSWLLFLGCPFSWHLYSKIDEKDSHC